MVVKVGKGVKKEQYPVFFYECRLLNGLCVARFRVNYYGVQHGNHRIHKTCMYFLLYTLRL